MPDYLIERGYTWRPRISRRARYPFDRLEVGESFCIPWDHYRGINHRRRLQKLAADLASKSNKALSPKHFKTQSDLEGVRIFRIR